MPSKLKKALGAVKDQTSISLAKVSKTNVSNLEVIILKATRHDEVPIDDRYITDILLLVSSNKVFAAACAAAIAKRIGKTRNWIVALKCLLLVLKVFQDGDPYFPREVLHVMKRGHKILNLSSFRDDSNSSPWDYTAFVRTFALYLDERLDCFLTGKLQKRFTNTETESSRNPTSYDPVCDMKPGLLLDKIMFWQKLLDRAMGTKPTGAAKSNKLVQISFYAVVQESFQLYRDISDGLALLLDSFFHLQYQSCASAFQCCVKASKQFEELCSFYDMCKCIGIGRTSEYPSVQKMSDELVETLEEFLKDQANSIPNNGRSPPHSLLPSKDPGTSSFSQCESWDQSSDPSSQRGSGFSSQCASLDDLMSGTEMGASPSCQSPSMDLFAYEHAQLQSDTGSNHSLPIDRGKGLTGILFIDEQHSPLDSRTPGGARDEWELVLAQTATQPVMETTTITSPTLPIMDSFLDQDSMTPSQSPYNPFLQDEIDISSPIVTAENGSISSPVSTDMFLVPPTFKATATPTPTFCAQSPNNQTPSTAFQDEFDDPFGPWSTDDKQVQQSVDQQFVLKEQELWLQNQNKIISKQCFDL